MAGKLQVAIDCADPATLAEFWAEAIGYQVQPPPEGHASWPDYLRAEGVPESQWNSFSALVDPSGEGPRIYLQRVPEPKTVKNRLHLDVKLAGGRQVPQAQRRPLLAAEVERLTKLGAGVIHEHSEPGGFWIVMHDPEGNEFCIS